MATRIEIFRADKWRALKLRDETSVRYNAVINKIGRIDSREISHTNTFELPPVFQNTDALNINIYNKIELALALNKKYVARYYVKDKLVQIGFLVINNTLGGVINVNFIDQALEITEKWGSITFHELLTTSSIIKPTDYQASLDEMTDYDLDKLSILTPLTETGTKGFNFALFPHALNVIGDEFQQPENGERLDQTFNPYQSRAIYNAKSLFDLATYCFGYTPEYDPSMDWDKIEKTFMVADGLDKSEVEDGGEVGDTYPQVDETFQNNYDYDGVTYDFFSIFKYDTSVAIQPSTISNYVKFSGAVDPGDDDYKISNSIFVPKTDQSFLGKVRFKAYMSQLDIQQDVYSTFVYALYDDAGTFHRIYIPIIDNIGIGKQLDFQIDKEEIDSKKPDIAATFLGVEVFVRSISTGYAPPPEELDSHLRILVDMEISETYLPEGVISYDEWGQYDANEVDLQHSAPKVLIKDLLSGIMQKEGILMNIDGKNKVVKFFTYGQYQTQKENGNFRDWSKYHQKYTEPLFNTDYGNSYAKRNEIGLSSPYLGNTFSLALELQGSDSKYKDYAENYANNFKDIQSVNSINNSITPYFEYRNQGLGLVELENTLGTLTQVRADGTSQGDFVGLQNLANVNYSTVPVGVGEWYRLVDRAVKSEAQFLLPVDEFRDLDLSEPIYVENLGGFWIIEEILEYTDDRTTVHVKLIKLIDNLINV